MEVKKLKEGSWRSQEVKMIILKEELDLDKCPRLTGENNIGKTISIREKIVAVRDS